MSLLNNAVLVGVLAAIGLSTVKPVPLQTEPGAIQMQSPVAIARLALWNEPQPCPSTDCPERQDPFNLEEADLHALGESILAKDVEGLTRTLANIVQHRSPSATADARSGADFVFETQLPFVVQDINVCMVVVCTFLAESELQYARVPSNVHRLARIAGSAQVNSFQVGAQNDALRFFAEGLIGEFAPR